jgi:misacylated tRNA(Ala) deacylase
MAICEAMMKDNMDPRMHSAEHLLNQTMNRLFQCGRCFSAHIERKKSKCDYHFHRPLTREEIQQIQEKVNEVIRADLEVNEAFMSRKEAGKRFHLDRLPEEAGERIRIIKIGDYDACPCIGPHVQSTGQIGRFRIGSASFEQEVLRIRFRLSTG